MYTLMPRSIIIQALKDFTTSNKNKIELPIDELIIFVTLLFNNSYFTFNNQVFIQTEGVSIGGVLSAILAEIAMRHVESFLLTQ